MNVDANRAIGSGNGAGNAAIAINTITIAETTLPEYSSGAGKSIVFQVRPGFQFDPSSPVSIQSTTVGFNGAAINVAAVVTPSGTADETITFELTSGTNTAVQDVIRVNGFKLKILSAEGAVGPAQTTMAVTTSSAGGAFTDQGIVASNITKGAPDRLVFSAQPGTSQSNADLFPSVSIVDFGGNIITNDARLITLTIEDNPGAATLNGITAATTFNGVVSWVDEDDLSITTAANGYTLRASHNGADFLTSDTVTSGEFDILAGAPNHLAITVQPVETDAGSPILVSVSVLDAGDNLVTNDPVDVTLDSAVNPGGWPLLADSSLTKTTVNGVAAWVAADNLRINKSTTGYKLTASGLGAPEETNEFDIIPGEPDHLAITNQPVDTTAGEDILITVTVQDAFNNVNTETPVDVELNLSENPGGATLEVGTELTKETSNGVATWNAADDLRIDVAASGYRILASGVGAANESDAFDVLAGGLDHLTITEQPISSLEGDNLLITVETRDAFENLVAANDVSITLAIGENPGGGTLTAASSLTKTTVDGVAAWNANDDLAIDAAGAGYTLTATDGDLSVESEAFSITAPPQNNDICGINCRAGSTMTLLPMLLLKAARRRRKMVLRHAVKRGGRA
ncbi:MAG: hypothetical protein IPK83_10650 [Planctomycetes bacterium]|nr:hypothetical protein [Planctomycetota bacterium]